MYKTENLVMHVNAPKHVDKGVIDKIMKFSLFAP